MMLGHPTAVPGSLFKTPPRRRACRAGFSLLEVILATAILAGSALLLATMISRGAMLAGRAQERAEAWLVAETVMSETIALRNGEVFDEEGTAGLDDAWTYQVEVTEIRERPLLRISVTVSPTDTTLETRSTAPTDGLVRLVRWYRPQGGLPEEAGEMP